MEVGETKHPQKSLVLDDFFRGIRGGIWRDMAGYREIPGDTGRYREIRSDKEEKNKMWSSDTLTRTLKKNKKIIGARRQTSTLKEAGVRLHTPRRWSLSSPRADYDRGDT